MDVDELAMPGDEIHRGLFRDGERLKSDEVLKNGQLKILPEGSPPDSVPVWETPPPARKGTYQLGITRDRRLMIYAEGDRGREIAWQSR